MATLMESKSEFSFLFFFLPQSADYKQAAPNTRSDFSLPRRHQVLENKSVVKSHHTFNKSMQAEYCFQFQRFI